MYRILGAKVYLLWFGKMFEIFFLGVNVNDLLAGRRQCLSDHQSPVGLASVDGSHVGGRPVCAFLPIIQFRVWMECVGYQVSDARRNPSEDFAQFFLIRIFDEESVQFPAFMIYDLRSGLLEFHLRRVELSVVVNLRWDGVVPPKVNAAIFGASAH